MTGPNTMATRAAALELALTKAGGITQMSKTLGITLQSITAWRSKCYVPMMRAFQIEKIWGVDHHDLMRPEDLAAMDPAVPETGSDLL